MISLSEAVKITGLDEHELDQILDDCNSLAVAALQRMPSIGFMSREKRLNAFLVVCEFLSSFEGDDATDKTMIAIQLMRKQSGKFDKCYTMFTIMTTQGRINKLSLNKVAYNVAVIINPNI